MPFWIFILPHKPTKVQAQEGHFAHLNVTFLTQFSDKAFLRLITFYEVRHNV